MVKVSTSHTIRHAHSIWLLLTSDQLVAEAATCTTQQTQETNIHALRGIRTRDPSTKAAADLRLEPHSYRDRRITYLLQQISRFYSTLIQSAITFHSSTTPARMAPTPSVTT
jgi:hypothetical protein